MRKKRTHNPQFLTASEAARRLQVDPRTVRQWRTEGKLVEGRHYFMQDRTVGRWSGRLSPVYFWPSIAEDFIERKEKT